MGRFVLVQHEVAGIGRGRQKDELEDGVVWRAGEGPEYVCEGSSDQQRVIVRRGCKEPKSPTDVSRDIDHQVECLRLERYA